MTTAAQNRAIHTLLSRIDGFGDDDYRALLQREFGGRSSSRLLSEREAIRLIDILKGLAGQTSGGSARRPSETASGPYAPILRALWIGAYNLGLTRSKDDVALIAFVTRQTGLEHTRWLNDPIDAARAIEGLKKWMSRGGGIEWPKDRGEDVVARKLALLEAIARRCVEAGAFTPSTPGAVFETAWPRDFEAYAHGRGLPDSFDRYRPEDYDRLANWLGQRLRGRLEKREAA